MKLGVRCYEVVGRRKCRRWASHIFAGHGYCTQHMNQIQPPEPVVEGPRCWQVIGIIDGYDAVHYHKCFEREPGDYGSDPNHCELWPTAQKRWRFKVRDWEISPSMCGESLTSEEYERIEATMLKILPVPEWVAHGRAWVAAGRPHGRANDRFEREYRRKNKACID